jgi:hypothetical protein
VLLAQVSVESVLKAPDHIGQSADHACETNKAIGNVVGLGAQSFHVHFEALLVRLEALLVCLEGLLPGSLDSLRL